MQCSNCRVTRVRDGVPLGQTGKGCDLVSGYCVTRHMAEGRNDMSPLMSDAKVGAEAAPARAKLDSLQNS